MGCARAIEGGQTFAQWRKAMLADPQALSVATLPKHRLDNIFRTNTQAAYLRGITRQQDQISLEWPASEPRKAA